MEGKPTYEQLERKIQKLEKELAIKNQSQKDENFSRKRHQRFLKFLPYPVLVRDKNGLVTYLNPAFTKTFKWTLKELKGNEGKQYVPSKLRDELNNKIKALPENKSILRLKTQRLTKDGQILDVAMRVGIDKDEDGNADGMITVLRDVTREERIDRNREAMNRMSLALPEYPELRDLLHYLNNEIKTLIGAQAANVILLDEAKQELFFLSSAHDDPSTSKRMEQYRFGLDELVSGQVIRTGKPIILNEESKDPNFLKIRDEKLGYKVNNVLLVPLRSQDSIIGVLSADNKKDGPFDQTDLETLNTIGSTVALSIENARFARELRKAYEEVRSLNSAKDKMINHLSHELKTPVAILMSSFKILTKRLDGIDKKTWLPTFERIKRNLERILGIQYEVDDIVKNKDILPKKIFSMIFEQCADELESLIAQEIGEGDIITKVRDRIEEIFGPKELVPENIILDGFVKERLLNLKEDFKHRQVTILTDLEPLCAVKIPRDPLLKIVDGLIKNAIENTPDGKKIRILVQKKGSGTQMVVHDYGIGITKDAQKRIFEGFFTTQATDDYSSKRPFDFNAGGKGADLLRMKIFSERYDFEIKLDSKRCQRIPNDIDICPGSVSQCEKIQNTENLNCDGMTIFSLYFPQISNTTK